MEEISRRIPSPGQTKRGRINCDGWSRVSRTRLRIDSVERSRRGRSMGKGIHSDFTKGGRRAGVGRWALGVGYCCAQSRLWRLTSWMGKKLLRLATVAGTKFFAEM